MMLGGVIRTWIEGLDFSPINDWLERPFDEKEIREAMASAFERDRDNYQVLMDSLRLLDVVESDLLNSLIIWCCECLR